MCTVRNFRACEKSSRSEFCCYGHLIMTLLLLSVLFLRCQCQHSSFSFFREGGIDFVATKPTMFRLPLCVPVASCTTLASPTQEPPPRIYGHPKPNLRLQWSFSPKSPKIEPLHTAYLALLKTPGKNQQTATKPRYTELGLHPLTQNLKKLPKLRSFRSLLLSASSLACNRAKTSLAAKLVGSMALQRMPVPQMGVPGKTPNSKGFFRKLEPNLKHSELGLLTVRYLIYMTQFSYVMFIDRRVVERRASLTTEPPTFHLAALNHTLR